MVAHGGNLRQMGNAQRLLLFRNGRQLAADLLSRMAGNAGVDLVKDQHTNIFARRQYVFKRKHNSA